jgi:hypothetical protein
MTRYFTKKKATNDEIASRDATMGFVDEYLQELCRLSGAQVRSLQQGGISAPRDLVPLSPTEVDEMLQPPLTSERHRAKLARVHTYLQGGHLLVPGKTKFNHILVMVGDDGTGGLEDETTTNYWQADDPYNVHGTNGGGNNTSIEVAQGPDEDRDMDDRFNDRGDEHDVEQARRHSGQQKHTSKSRKHKRKSSQDGGTTDDSDSYDSDSYETDGNTDPPPDDDASPRGTTRTAVMADVSPVVAGAALLIGISVGAVVAQWVFL